MADLMLSKPAPERPELQALLDRARAKLAAMSPEEIAVMRREQAISWVYGEVNFDCAPGEERVSREQVARIVDAGQR